MATLPGQRAQFTWALNQYNLAEDDLTRATYAKRMAKYISAAPANGFTVEQVTQDQTYPVAEVERYLSDPSLVDEPGITEQQAIEIVKDVVDTSNAVRIGQGSGVVYAYGYRCIPGRLKVGSTEGDTVQRIAAQIGTSTPDKPTLLLEIRTENCRERAIQLILEARGRKVVGGGTEWFTTTPDEVVHLYRFVKDSH
jgi:hypothetical protein